MMRWFRYMGFGLLSLSFPLILAACNVHDTVSVGGTPKQTSANVLQPSQLGNAACHDGGAGTGWYAQVEISNATCTDADVVASVAAIANNGAYPAAGFQCTPTTQGSSSKWAAAWRGTFYAYSCVDGSEQIAFTWGPESEYLGVSSTGPSGSPSPSPSAPSGGTQSSTGVGLQPAALGDGECQDGGAGSGWYAQVAISGATCMQADTVMNAAASANDGSFTESGFHCTPTAEGSSSQWASAWSGTFYAYSCADGSEQIAFTWGPESAYLGA